MRDKMANAESTIQAVDIQRVLTLMDAGDTRKPILNPGTAISPYEGLVHPKKPWSDMCS